MVYMDLRTTFVYKLLMTYQLMDMLAENDAMFLQKDCSVALSPAQTRYYSIGPTDLMRANLIDNPVILVSGVGPYFYMKSASNTIIASCYFPVHLPNGAVVTSLKVYWYRDDAAAAGTAALFRAAVATGTTGMMAQADSNSTAGNHSVEDTTISNATIDNTGYYYGVGISLDPNDDWDDVSLYSIVITYTVTQPLP